MVNLWNAFPKTKLTTGIGSLPHHNTDAALQYAFRFSIPFLPQLPLRNPNEFMILQALEQFPGLVALEKGEAVLDLDKWNRSSGNFHKKLDDRFKTFTQRDTFDDFLPSSDFWSAWGPFLWELKERKLTHAKIQISGPLTCQWALKLSNGKPADSIPEIGMQIFRTLLARSIAMIRTLQKQGVTPLIYIDEPSFYCFNADDPKHKMGLNELKLFIQSLKKENALVGLHCCSNTDWKSILSLGLDVLSFDVSLSLASLFDQKKSLDAFLKGGGRLSLGIIPTIPDHEKIQNFEVKSVMEQVEKLLTKADLEKSIFTPACGLAFHRPDDAETILSYLQ
jgi:hypothetical protein